MRRKIARLDPSVRARLARLDLSQGGFAAQAGLRESHLSVALSGAPITAATVAMIEAGLLAAERGAAARVRRIAGPHQTVATTVSPR